MQKRKRQTLKIFKHGNVDKLYLNIFKTLYEWFDTQPLIFCGKVT